MVKKSWRAQIKRWAICLAPTAIILLAISIGAGLHLPLFALSWNNDCVFALLVIALLLAVTKLPLLLLGQVDDEAVMILEARDGQLSLLRARLAYLTGGVNE